MSIDCLKDCNGACCREVPICGVLEKGAAENFRMRGLTVLWNDELQLYVVYAPKCPYLIEDGRCSIHNTKPDWCKDNFEPFEHELCHSQRAIHYFKKFKEGNHE